MPESLRNIVAGRDQLPAGHRIGRHRHEHAYAILTLAGSMQQVSYAGRVTTQTGQLLVQPTLDCHANRSGPAGVSILRLPWRRECGLGGLFELAEADQLIRLAELDPIAASKWAINLVGNAPRVAPTFDDWEDLLAAELATGKVSSLSGWAAHHGIAAETVSRGFARRYHCTPARFRGELRTRNAWLRLTGSALPLAEVAAEAGFADQAHMTRSVGRLTGRSPGYWRAYRGSPDEVREYP
jgi:AraC-like DNA-binding protein